MFSSKIAKGETLHATFPSLGYMAPDGWGLRIYFAGPSVHEFQGVEGGGPESYDVAVDTSSFSPGYYVYEAWVVRDSEKHFVAKGSLTINPSAIGAEPGTDLRSSARKALDAIDAVLAKSATYDQRHYKINDRELDRHSPGELLKLQKHFRAQVRFEERRDKGQSLHGPSLTFRF